MNPKSSPDIPGHDAAMILTVQSVVRAEVSPVLSEVREINARLAKGDTMLALHDQRIKNMEETRTDRIAKRGPNPYLMMLLTGALGAAGSVAALWFLVGIGQHASKVSP